MTVLTWNPPACSATGESTLLGASLVQLPPHRGAWGCLAGVQQAYSRRIAGANTDFTSVLPCSRSCRFLSSAVNALFAETSCRCPVVIDITDIVRSAQ